MKYLLLYVFVCVLSCEQDKNCSEKILKSNLCAEYNDAKWEMYIFQYKSPPILEFTYLSMLEATERLALWIT